MAHRIETLKRWPIVISFLVFLVVCIIGFCVGLACPETSTDELAGQASFQDLTTGGLMMISPNVSKINQELKLVALVRKVATYIGVQQRIHFNVSGGPITDGVLVYHYRVNHDREVSCPLLPLLPTEPLTCDPVILYHENVINAPQYHAIVSIPDPMSKLQNFENVSFYWVRNSPLFTSFEISYRYTFFALSAIALILFIVSCIIYVRRGGKLDMQIKKVGDHHHDHMWTGALLIGVCLLDNPLFAACFSEYWFFPMINGIFQSTFIALVMLYLVIVFGGLLNPSRTCLKFYLPRFLLVAPIWLFLIIGEVWADVFIQTDPTYSMYYDFPGWKFIQIVVLVFLGLYFLLYVFNIIRLFNIMRRIKINAKRYWFLIISVHLVVLVFVVGMVFYTYIPGPERSGTYLGLFAMMNAYVWLLALFYSPTHEKPEFPMDQVTKAIEDQASRLSDIGSGLKSGLGIDSRPGGAAGGMASREEGVGSTTPIAHDGEGGLADDDDGDLAARPGEGDEDTLLGGGERPKVSIHPDRLSGVNLDIDEAAASHGNDPQ